MNRTTLVWGIVAGLVLMTGSFLLGMYYGYYQGYSARQAQVDEEPARVAEPVEENAQADDDRDFEAVITDEDLSGTDAAPGDTPDATGTDTSGRIADESATDEEPGETDTIAVRANALSEGRPAEEDVPTRGSTASDDAPSVPEDDEGTETSETGEDEETNRIVSTSGPTYTIQVVSYVEESRALRRRDALREAGHDVTITTKKVNGRQRYRVRLGAFSSREDAQEEAESLKENGVIEDYWISQIRS